MRVVYTFFILLTALSLQAQETLITKTKIPLGLQVKHIETDSLIDISLLCEGFDENRVPKNLIVPANTKVSIFLPEAIKNDDVSYWSMDTSRYVGVIQKGGVGTAVPENLRLLYKYDFEYDGQTFLRLINDELASMARMQYSLLKQTIMPDGTRQYSDTTHIYFESELAPIRVREVYLNTEIIAHISQIEARHRIVELLRTSNSWFKNFPYPDRTYEHWIQAGYTSEQDSTILPVNPVFPHDENDFFFSFTRFLSAKDITFQRNGSDIPISREMILPNSLLALQNLKSGDYELRIDNSNSTYDKSPTIYQFSIKGSFWNQGGYWLAILLPLFLILFFIYRTYVKIKLNRFNLMKQLTEAELKAIRAQLNPHFLFNALNAIQNQVNKQNTEQANAYIAKLSRLMRLVLNQSAEPFHSLQLELEIAQLYLELEKLRFPFEYIINVPEDLNGDMLVPTMLLQPYLENAVVHGVQAGGATSIYLTVVQQENTCTFKISDNGSGTSANSGNGKGMKMSSDRLKVIEQQHKINTSIKVKPAKDGYEVVIQVPTDL